MITSRTPAPASACGGAACANRWPGPYGATLVCGHGEESHRDGFCDVVIGDDILCGCPVFVPPPTERK